MKKALMLPIATFISIFIALSILIFISTVKKITTEANEILYVLVVEIAQMFFPFLIYVFICNFLVEKVTNRFDQLKAKKALVHFAVYIALMIIVTVCWSCIDIFLSGYVRELVHYIKEFSLFIIFSPVAAVVTYLMSNRLRHVEA